jgi:uncharacterized protein YgbK (DUF1537 family)
MSRSEGVAGESERILILADDLTGSVDSSVAFAARGLPVSVAVRAEGLAPSRFPHGIVAINTDTRRMPPSAAHDRVLGIARTVAACDPRVVFKKIDSRLKGNLAAELAAVLAVFPRETLLVAPAVPRLGRHVRGGRLNGLGVGLPIDLGRELAGIEANVEIPDVTRESDLDLLASRLMREPGRILPVGASSFAAAIARRFRVRDAAFLGVPSGPILFVVGSRDPITLAQVAHLRNACPTLLHAAAPDGALNVPGEVKSASLAILQCVDGRPGSQVDDETAVAERFATGVEVVVGEMRPTVLVLSGGDTASAVLRRLGIETLQPARELLPGVPISEVHPPCRELPACVVTKSGGFGSVETLLKIARGLAGRSSHP